MWKYLAILAFLVVSIREINLMYHSLYVAPDARKVVFEDETFAAQIKNLIDEEKDYIQQFLTEKESLKESPQEKYQQKEPHTTPKHTKVIIISRTKPTNTSSLQKEQNLSTYPSLQLCNTSPKPKEHLAKAPGDLPTNFESAQKRVQNILQQMRGY